MPRFGRILPEEDEARPVHALRNLSLCGLALSRLMGPKDSASILECSINKNRMFGDQTWKAVWASGMGTGRPGLDPSWARIGWATAGTNLGSPRLSAICERGLRGLLCRAVVKTGRAVWTAWRPARHSYATGFWQVTVAWRPLFFHKYLEATTFWGY